MTPTILDFWEKSKSLAGRMLRSRELFPVAVITIVGITSFGLGRLSVQNQIPVSQGHLVSSAQSSVSASTTEMQTDSSHSDENNATQQGSSKTNISAGEATQTAPSDATVGEKKYVASKNGTKYHLPWCSGAAHIKEENKVWFASKEEAAAAGYAAKGFSIPVPKLSDVELLPVFLASCPLGSMGQGDGSGQKAGKQFRHWDVLSYPYDCD
jgi:hypothetical protein